MPTPPSRPFSEYSDDEFYEHLKGRNHLNPWTLRELVEVERRGLEFLDRDPELRKLAEATKDKFLEGMRGALKPVTDNIREIGMRLAKDSSLKGFEAISGTFARNNADLFKPIYSPFLESLARRTSETLWFQENKRNREIVRKFGQELEKDAEEVSHFDVTEVTGSIDSDQMALPATDPETIEIVKEPFERKLEDEIGGKMIALLGEITTNTKNTSDRVKFGWQQWVMMLLTAIAAGTGVWTVIRHP